MTTHTAASLDAYFAIVRNIRTSWNTPEAEELWFRAEDAQYQNTCLQPGLYRPKDGSVRKEIRNLLKLENDLYDEYLRCSPQFSDVKSSGEDWEWEAYLLMQHHGVPTRLLDWSDGAIIALHFAVREKHVPPNSGSVIYILDPCWLGKLIRRQRERKSLESRWKRFAKKEPCHYYEDDWPRLYLPADDDDMKEPLLATPNIPMLDDAPHVTRRVGAQRSRFMVFGSNPLWLSRLTRKRDSRIASVSIPESAIANIKHELRDAGITESVVYPDLDGLGRELRQIWETRR